MRSRTTCAVFMAAVLVACGCSAGTTAGNGAARLVRIGAGLSGPSGLHATVYAQGLVHASAFAADSSGRLWVATAAYTDSGKDGVYLVASSTARAVEVVTNLHKPLGLLWSRGELFIASERRVDAYSGLVGNHFTKRRTVLLLPKGVGEVNALTLASNGRLLMGISAACDHCSPVSQYSGAIVSFRRNGTDLRIYATKIRAPIGLAYFPGTKDLFVTMNQRDDLGAKTPGDWLAVVTEGSSWGFPNCYGQHTRSCAGQPKPVAELDKHAAVSDVAIVTGQLGPSVGTAAVVAEWATSKVLRVALHRSGSSYKTTVSTFLTGLKNPVAVMLASSGALLVGDWTNGTVYRVTR